MNTPFHALSTRLTVVARWWRLLLSRQAHSWTAKFYIYMPQRCSNALVVFGRAIMSSSLYQAELGVNGLIWSDVEQTNSGF